MATVGDASAPRRAILAGQPAVHDALAGRESRQPAAAAERHPAGGHRADPICLTHPEILGTLSAGFLLDDSLAAQLKEITGSDVAFGMDGRILATTLPRDDDAALASLLRRRTRHDVTLGGEEYAVLPRAAAGAGDPAGAGPVALILRSRTEQLQFFRAIHTGLTVDGDRRGGAGDAPQLRGRADDHASARRDHRRHARSGRRPAT